MARRLVTVWIALLFALLFRAAHASDALILIPGENAGPNVPAALEAHPNWILWPEWYPPETGNGLLSIFSGHDWLGKPTELQFKSGAKAKWIAIGYRDLVQSGYLTRKNVFLKGRPTLLIADGHGDSSAAALLLSLSIGRPEVSAIRLRTDLPEDAILVFQAHSWDDVAFITRRCGGSVLAVEYPPRATGRWSRFWMFGKWPTQENPSSPQLGLEGVVRARDLCRTLLDPLTLTWSERKAAPQPWLERTSSISPMIRGIYLAAVLVALGFGCYLIRTEQSFPFFRGLLLLLLGFPAIDLAAGALSAAFGLSAWIVLVPALGCGLLGILTVANASYEGRESKGDICLIAISVLGLLACLLGSASHSDYSPILSTSAEPVSFEVLGFTGAYALALLVPMRSWGGRFAIVALMIVAIGSKGLPSFLELAIGSLALISTLPITWYGAALVVCALGVGIATPLRFAWRPFGLMPSESQALGIDVNALLLQWISLPFLAFFATLAATGISTLGFGQHQIVHVHRKNPLSVPLLKLSLYLALGSLVAPGMVSGALVVILGWALITCYLATA